MLGQAVHPFPDFKVNTYLSLKLVIEVVPPAYRLIPRFDGGVIAVKVLDGI